VINANKRALERMRSAFNPAEPAATPVSNDVIQSLHAQVEATKQGFLETMDDDFNTAGALGHIFELVRAINQARDQGIDTGNLEQAQTLLRELSDILGLRLQDSIKFELRKGDIGPYIDLLIEVRLELRKQKLWQLSDRIRDRLKEIGAILEDRKDGTTTWKFES
jgi:cysteinyl-tRNA synthetase